MKIVFVGAGYVGLVTGCCFAEMGNTVTCVDSSLEKVKRLSRGDPVIHESGLEELLQSNLAQGRLHFASDLAGNLEDCDAVFIAVGTPPLDSGEADLSFVRDAADAIGTHVTSATLVVTKSTVPVGTGDLVQEIIDNKLQDRKAGFNCPVVSNPEFLKEGDAIEDFMKPDRIVIGSDSESAREIMTRLYKPFNRNHNKIMYMGRRDAEMTKYAANAMLATRISFMNEVAGLCDLYNVDVENVRLGIGSDSRIGYSFIYPGAGYGGSCFPKDVRAAIQMGNRAGFDTFLLDAVESRNNLQKQYLFQRYIAEFGENAVNGNIFAVWGLSFKPGTDDMREAPSIELVRALVNAGGQVRAHDPVAGSSARQVFPEEWFADGRLEIKEDQYDALDDAQAVFVVTEWKPYRRPDLSALKKRMANPCIFDGRNLYEPELLRSAGLLYYGIGR